MLGQSLPAYSGSEGGECLEVAHTERQIHIRDSKNPDDNSPTLAVTPTAWAAFTATR
nr:DUF397 domain-containing protein [Streptomyces sp. NBC_00886]